MDNIFDLLLDNLLLGIRVDIDPVEILIIVADVDQRIASFGEEPFPFVGVWRVVDINEKR